MQKIVYLFGLLLIAVSDVFQPPGAHQVPQHQGQGVIEVFIGGSLRLHGKVVQQLGAQPLGQVYPLFGSGLFAYIGHKAILRSSVAGKRVCQRVCQRAWESPLFQYSLRSRKWQYCAVFHILFPQNGFTERNIRYYYQKQPLYAR